VGGVEDVAALLRHDRGGHRQHGRCACPRPLASELLQGRRRRRRTPVAGQLVGRDLTHGERGRALDRDLEWGQARYRSPLHIALDHLTLGRAALYEFLLSAQAPRGLASAKTELDAAVDGLRRASAQEFVASGLLTRAWLRYLTGARTGPDSAQADLDEAWEIAERGPMPLFQADIHLHRARLFGRNADDTPSPWDSPQHDLAEARRLIEKHGYARRNEELQDAESALAPPRR
jgi:hypothetical protein